MDTKNFNNLETIELSSPASFYLDSDRFDQELQCVWFRNWIFAAHISDLPEIGDFLVSRIGDQEIIIVRTESGIRGYFNTCRHRGSALCAESVGHFHSGRRMALQLEHDYCENRERSFLMVISMLGSSTTHVLKF